MRFCYLLAALAAILMFAACSGDDDDSSDTPAPGTDTATASLTAEGTQTPSGTSPAETATASPTITRPTPGLPRLQQNGGPEPEVDGSGAEYSLLFDEIPYPDFQVYSPGTRQIENEELIEASSNPDAVRETIAEQGRLIGYQAEYAVASEFSLLSGPVSIVSTAGLYLTVEGAGEAIESAAGVYSGIEQFEPVQVEAVGNEHMAHSLERLEQLEDGREVSIVTYFIDFRRGNVVVTVALTGATAIVAPEEALALARVIDEKILGQRPAPMPTPAGTAPPATGTATASATP
jgi:hypothetical protein